MEEQQAVVQLKGLTGIQAKKLNAKSQVHTRNTAALERGLSGMNSCVS